MEKTDLIKYWVDGSDRDFTTMEHLFEKEDYHWALFIGHLVIEWINEIKGLRKWIKEPLSR